MTTMDNLGEEFMIKFVNDFCNVERNVGDTAAKSFRDMAFILFLSSALRWSAKLGVHVILDIIIIIIIIIIVIVVVVV